MRALNAAVLRLLRPLCRLLLRHNVPFSVFEELAKHVYVQAAMDDFCIPGKKPTLSRASILTGLTRKDVQRIVAEPEPAALATDESYNRAARVLTGWARDPAFRDAQGQPALLHPHEGPTSFAVLVRRHSGDMPARAVLDELVRVGAVRRRDDESLELLTAAYLPQAGQAEKLGILGSDVADLIATIDHNLQHGTDDPRFQRKVMYRNFSAHHVAAFRQHSAARSQALLEEFDQWLSEHADADSSAGPGALPPMRLGIGIFYFQEPMAPGQPREK